jgi:hypothetical protein
MTHDIAATPEQTLTGIETKESESSSEKDLCANCGAQLAGQFCHTCGQSSRSMIKFFGEVIRELLDDALGYDSRAKHSIFPLMFKPGRLTLDYVKGKRFYYVMPFRLYLMTSILLILLIKGVANTDELKFENMVDESSRQEISEELNKEVQQIFDDINQLEKNNQLPASEVEKTIADRLEQAGVDKEVARQILKERNEQLADDLTSDDSSEARVERSEEHDNSDISIGDGGEDDINLNWDNERQQLSGVEEMDDSWLRTFLEVINPKLKNWKEDPGPLVDSFFEALPYMMFVILPVFAIFLKLFYAFSKRYYTEHLIFLLHNHSFIYIVLMFEILFDLGEAALRPIETSLAQTGAGVSSFLSVILSFWMIIYVFLAMKRFYRQGWIATIFKTISLGFIYLILISIGFFMALILGAYQA